MAEILPVGVYTSEARTVMRAPNVRPLTYTPLVSFHSQYAYGLPNGRSKRTALTTVGVVGILALQPRVLLSRKLYPVLLSHHLIVLQVPLYFPGRNWVPAGTMPSTLTFLGIVMVQPAFVATDADACA